MREAFYEVYAADNLQALERQWAVELFEHGKDFLPAILTPPQKGTWYAAEIMDAEYFFG